MTEEPTSSFFGENRSLFSDYYLSERLTDHPEWSADVSEPFQRALKLYKANKAALPKMNESQTEKEFIQPILSEVLGYQFDVQHSEKQSGRLNIPDYIFFDDEESLKEAQAHREEKGKYYAEALALGDAKYWGRSLDGKGVAEKDRLTNANPSFQIVNYLTVTGLDWGILTNGSHWRLYSMKSRSRIDSYFEVDLKRILEEEDEEQFKYFYHFFRAQAFREDPETAQHFLGSVLSGSTDYGTRLEGRLKELIFDDIFLTLGKGFTDFRANEARNENETDESLQEIYQGTLRLLYRLLFLLHAESRSLLPLGNKDYFQYSLMKLKQDIAERVEQGLTPSRRSFDVWNDLDSLFNIIDKGDPDLNVPRYNGGLFRGDHPKNQFLAEHKISDKYLVPALELLTREPDPKTGRKRFIDYKSLNLEQLGSIYEGLLEFHLRIADQPLSVVKKRGREVFEPEKDVKNPSLVIPKGALYLENDKGERKATGSYYTPHYIVEYIVEHTLGPVFDKRAETFENLMGKLEPKYGEYGKLDQKITAGDHSERTHNKRKALHLEIESLENKAKEGLLSIKICDPAMGSGHFLKEATDKLAEKIITLLAQYPQNPVTKLLNRVREEILASLDEQDISIDADEHLKDTNLIKRMVMKRSIYGVDLNPMAVELAKLSLWLDSFTVGAPLSFLDHHLKTGNSLIGTTVKEVKFTLELDEERQIEAFGGPFTALLTATQFMRDVAQRTDATISEVQESVAKYHDYEEAIKPYKRLLDLWISRHFDNDKAIVLLRQYPDKIIKEVKGEASDLHENYLPVLEQAEAQAESKRFFHWELEFPEVFIDLKHSKWLENPGFDAVVGNPPWVNIGRQSGSSDEVQYLKSAYDSTEYQIDLYTLFVEKGINLLRQGQSLGNIVPNPWLANYRTSLFRKLVLIDNTPKKLVDTPINAFPGVSAEHIILIVQKKNKSETEFLRGEISADNGVKYYDKYSTSLLSKDDGYVVFTDSNLANIIDKIENSSNRLDELYDTVRGVGPYHHKYHDEETISTRAYHASSKKDDTFVPELKGGNLDTYTINWNKDTWISYGDWLAEPREKRFFTGKRLLLREILSDRFAVTVLLDDFIVDRGIYIAKQGNQKIDLLFVLAILGSPLLIFWFREKYSEKDEIFPKLRMAHFKQLPIKKIPFSTSKEILDRSLKNFKKEYLKFLASNATKNIITYVKEETDNSSELDFFYEILVYLAGQMLKFTKEKQRLQSALDPFKFLNKGVAFKKFSDVFSEAIKYGQQGIGDIDIGTVHHDIEGLRLTEDGDQWLLSLHLKHRDPETDWADWIKEDGHIVRSTHLVYRFELPDEQAHYWQQAFEVLEEFENSSTIPGGKTRTTHEKLMKTKVPVFDDSANIQPLIELREELAEVNQKIEKTDGLIDQVVYQLYGLSEEEIGVVEGIK